MHWSSQQVPVLFCPCELCVRTENQERGEPALKPQAPEAACPIALLACPVFHVM